MNQDSIWLVVALGICTFALYKVLHGVNARDSIGDPPARSERSKDLPDLASAPRDAEP